MLRILVFEEPFSVKLRLEGTLTAQTVPLLTQRWAEVRSGLKDRRAILDLGDLLDFDEAGRSTLGWLVDSGARLCCAPPRLEALVEGLRGRSPGIFSWLRSGFQQRRAAWRSSWLYQWICAMLPTSFRPCGGRAA